jgi:hypothetical protein
MKNVIIGLMVFLPFALKAQPDQVNVKRCSKASVPPAMLFKRWWWDLH